MLTTKRYDYVPFDTMQYTPTWGITVRSISGR